MAPTYADMAASGPPQSAEEAVPPPIPSIEPTTATEDEGRVIGDSHVQIAPPNLKDTMEKEHASPEEAVEIINREEEERKVKQEEAADSAKESAKDTAEKTKEAVAEKAEDVKAKAKSTVNNLKAKAKDSVEDGTGKDLLKKAKGEAKPTRTEEVALEGSVGIVNALLIGGIAYYGYTKYSGGQWTGWQALGLGVGAVVLLAGTEAGAATMWMKNVRKS